MRPESGRARPAIRLSTVLLPAPERPKSAVTPPPVANATSSAKVPRRQRTSSSSIAARRARRGAAHEDLGSHQRRERKEDGQDGQAERLCIAAGHLREEIG